MKIIKGHYFHIFNRGVNREKIFFTPANWDFFMQRVRKYFVDGHVTVIAYCLMPNHYHFLIRVNSDMFGKKVMLPFGTSYTKAINHQENRVGSLFQGSYRARLVDQSSDLLNLSRYIHLNPVTAWLAEQPADWEYSSFWDYSRKRSDALVDTSVILDNGLTSEAYSKFVLEFRSPEDGISEHLLHD